MAVIEAKRSTLNPADAAAQGRAYAEHLDVPFVFLSNGKEIRFWDFKTEAHPRSVKTFFKQDDLRTAHRRAAPSSRSARTVPVDRHIVERLPARLHRDPVPGDEPRPQKAWSIWPPARARPARRRPSSSDCSGQRHQPRLLLVDRIPLALQTEDAFNEHLREYPAYVLRAGRRFQDEKRITITNLQSMMNIYRDYSTGYFWISSFPTNATAAFTASGRACWHFEGIQIGLTATPCVTAELDTGDEKTANPCATRCVFEVDRAKPSPTTCARPYATAVLALPDLQGQDGQDRSRGRIRGQAR